MSAVPYGLTGLPHLDHLLAHHPRLVASGASAPGMLQFGSGRLIVLDSPQGLLLELEDNNPLVCAEEAFVPGPSATLVLIALGPVIQAGLVRVPPSLLFSYMPDDLDTDALGIEADVAAQPMELGSVLALNAMLEVPLSTVPDDLDLLYEEAYGRAFFVQAAEEEWDTRLVAGRPHAVYRLRLTPGEASHLLTVQVMADRDGKCGAAQVVHKLNVMCGFEETLGLA